MPHKKLFHIILSDSDMRFDPNPKKPQNSPNLDVWGLQCSGIYVGTNSSLARCAVAESNNFAVLLTFLEQGDRKSTLFYSGVHKFRLSAQMCYVAGHIFLQSVDFVVLWVTYSVRMLNCAVQELVTYFTNLETLCCAYSRFVDCT
jgi:hypothetical protein